MKRQRVTTDELERLAHIAGGLVEIDNTRNLAVCVVAGVEYVAVLPLPSEWVA